MIMVDIIFENMYKKISRNHHLILLLVVPTHSVFIVIWFLNLLFGSTVLFLNLMTKDMTHKYIEIWECLHKYFTQKQYRFVLPFNSPNRVIKENMAHCIVTELYPTYSLDNQARMKVRWQNHAIFWIILAGKFQCKILDFLISECVLR